MLRLIVVLLIVLTIFSPSNKGCRPEVCRRKRSPGFGDDGLVLLRGCSGQTAAWVTQMAFCLDLSAIDVAFGMREWYEVTYQACFDDCIPVRQGTSEVFEVNTCVDCFKNNLVRSNILDQFDNVNATEDVFPCVEQYVVPFLNDAPATLEIMSQNNQRASGRVDIPREARTDDWWALAVRLPCKPPLFQYFDANCINSFADEARSRDFVLAKNPNNNMNDIRFIVTFNDVCRFDPEDIEIVWEKSVPGFVFPQFSSFPSAFPPQGDQFGQIMFDSTQYTRYQETVGQHLDETRRKKRSPSMGGTPIPPPLGIAMPCQVQNFKVTDRFGGELVMESKGARYLIEPQVISQLSGNTRELDNYNTLNFTINFGYEKTGCSFGSNEPAAVVDPPPGWLDISNRITCFTCRNAASEEECLRSGVTLCQRGEICQSEVRQIATNRISISKMCKQSDACASNWVHNIRFQCRPGMPASVCRCCCSSDRCNTDAYHCT